MKGKIDLLAEYVQQLKKEGIGMGGAALVMKLAPDNYMVSLEGAAGQKWHRHTLKKETPLLYELFASSRDLSAVMQTRPRYSVQAANEGRDLPPVLDDMAQIVGPKARVCAEADEARIIAAFKKGNGCLLKAKEEVASSALAVGRSPGEAFAATLILEKSAQAFIESRCLGGAKPLNCLIAWAMHKQYNLVYSKMDRQSETQNERDIPRRIPERELALREEIIAYGKKLSKENLIQGTWGNISVRLDGRYMLVTPSGLDYLRLSPYDIVRVDMETLKYEGRLKPTSEKGIHAALLAANSDVNGIIHSHPVNCSVFAAARKPLPVEDEAERALLGKETGFAKTAIPGTKQLVRAVTEAISGNQKTCIMGNHGILACGESLGDALEKCRAMERAARRYLDRMMPQCRETIE
jgi:L-ribulose-5-phosphate 4-epimerase